MISPQLLKILVCPKCKGEIKLISNEGKEWLICKACKLRYPIIDDIPVMRVDKAERLEEDEKQG
ncbi:Trm112 family protein [Candidatus Sumerlaeota bacterium]|nr:Trm112 family protein [Candidatus Sumerlaeota bacterium]